MTPYGISIFIIELLLAEMIFICYYPKRKYFLFRMIGGFILLPLLGFAFINDGILMTNQFYQFFKYVGLFIVSILYMTFCFKTKAIPLISACVSGYTLQHLSYQITRMITLSDLFLNSGVEQFRDLIFEAMIFPITYVLAFFIFGRNVKKYEFYKNYDYRLLIISAFSLFICLVINRFTRISANLGNPYVVIGNSLYAISSCLLVLFMNYSLHYLDMEKNKNETLERISYQERKQYETSKNNREKLNIKYHDLKHILSLIKNNDVSNIDFINQYQKVLNDYDSEIESGNETLDIVLNEKLAKCLENSITLTYLGDGKLIDFINQYDLYSLMGNILDNAIEASIKIQDASKRVISMTIEKQGKIISIDCMNYYESKIITKNNEIITSKNEELGFHGYGLQSIKMIAKKYNGEVSIGLENNIFDLNILLFNND